jgi:hypothetical protein
MPGAMTLIEIKPHHWGWKVFECPGVEPVFPEKQDTIGLPQKMSPNEPFFELYRRKALAAARRSLAIVSALVG